MAYFPKFIKTKIVQKDEYSAVRTSEDATSKDGFLEKGQNLYQPEPSFWRRYRMAVIVQLVITGFWTMIVYSMALKIRSLSTHGPDVIHCSS
jgi:hypothetical protein